MSLMFVKLKIEIPKLQSLIEKRGQKSMLPCVYERKESVTEFPFRIFENMENVYLLVLRYLVIKETII